MLGGQRSVIVSNVLLIVAAAASPLNRAAARGRYMFTTSGITGHRRLDTLGVRRRFGFRCGVKNGQRQQPPHTITRIQASSMQQTEMQTKVKVVEETWLWRGYNVSWTAQGPSDGQPLLLIHGFGLSSKNFRSNMPALAEAGYRVYALDLLGLGGSEKPQLQYSTQLWTDQASDFVSEVIRRPTVLVGNSLGSLVSLKAATERKTLETTSAVDTNPLVKGIVLLNCASGMNSKIDDPSGVMIEAWKLAVFKVLFAVLEAILRSPLAAALFKNLRDPESIKNVLKNVYTINPHRVDDELVEPIIQAANDPGAFEAFVSILTGPPGPRPETLMNQPPNVPILVLWGDQDFITELNGPVGSKFQQLAASEVISERDLKFVVLEKAGHCPHDDDPDTVNSQIIQWLASLSK